MSFDDLLSKLLARLIGHQDDIHIHDFIITTPGIHNKVYNMKSVSLTITLNQFNNQCLIYSVATFDVGEKKEGRKKDLNDQILLLFLLLDQTACII